MKKQIPNILTYSRILVVPALVVSIALVCSCTYVDFRDGENDNGTVGKKFQGTGGFETFVRSLNDKKYGIKVIKDPDKARLGEKFYSFEVRPGDCGSSEYWNDCTSDRERSEISALPYLYLGQHKWIAWSVFIPEDFEDTPDIHVTLGQIHHHGGPKGIAGGLKSFPPLFQFDLTHDDYSIVYHSFSGNINNVIDKGVETPLKRLNEMRGHWTDVLLDINLSMKNGYAKVFIDGKFKALIRNPIIFKPDNFYFKFGLYRSFISRHKRPMPIQKVFFDEVRIGNSRKEVDIRINKNLKPAN